MPPSIDRLLQATVAWQKTKDNAYVFETSLDGTVVRLRLNDFPEEPLCTVIVDGHETDLHEFPKGWTLPRHRGETC